MSESKFRLGVKVPDFSVTVAIEAPGGERLGDITAVMRWKSRAEIVALGGQDLVDALGALIVSWDLCDDGNVPVAPEPAEFTRLHAEYPFVVQQLWIAYLEAANGIARKN